METRIRVESTLRYNHVNAFYVLFSLNLSQLKKHNYENKAKTSKYTENMIKDAYFLHIPGPVRTRTQKSFTKLTFRNSSTTCFRADCICTHINQNLPKVGKTGLVGRRPK